MPRGIQGGSQESAVSVVYGNQSLIHCTEAKKLGGAGRAWTIGCAGGRGALWSLRAVVVGRQQLYRKRTGLRSTLRDTRVQRHEVRKLVRRWDYLVAQVAVWCWRLPRSGVPYGLSGQHQAFSVSGVATDGLARSQSRTPRSAVGAHPGH